MTSSQIILLVGIIVIVLVLAAILVAWLLGRPRQEKHLDAAARTRRRRHEK